MIKIQIDEIWFSNNSNDLFLDMLFMGNDFYLRYSNNLFSYNNTSHSLNGYKQGDKLTKSKVIINIKENEELDNYFMLTESGDILRFNITDGHDGVIFEEFTIEKYNSNPESYYQSVLKWYNEGNDVVI